MSCTEGTFGSLTKSKYWKLIKFTIQTRFKDFSIMQYFTCHTIYVLIRRQEAIQYWFTILYHPHTVSSGIISELCNFLMYLFLRYLDVWVIKWHILSLKWFKMSLELASEEQKTRVLSKVNLCRDHIHLAVGLWGKTGFDTNPNPWHKL